MGHINIQDTFCSRTGPAYMENIPHYHVFFCVYDLFWYISKSLLPLILLLLHLRWTNHDHFILNSWRGTVCFQRTSRTKCNALDTVVAIQRKSDMKANSVTKQLYSDIARSTQITQKGFLSVVIKSGRERHIYSNIRILYPKNPIYLFFSPTPLPLAFVSLYHFLPPSSLACTSFLSLYPPSPSPNWQSTSKARTNSSSTQFKLRSCILQPPHSQHIPLYAVPNLGGLQHPSPSLCASRVDQVV